MFNIKAASVAAFGLVALTLGGAQAFAATEGPSATSDLNIEVKATVIKVTVPTEASMIFNEDETVAVPTNFDIKNESTITDLSLTGFSLDGGSSWKVVSDSKDLKLNRADTQEARIKVGPSEGAVQTIAPTSGDAAATGSTTWANGAVSIAPQSTQNIAFKVDRGAFSTDVAKAKAYGMQLDFEFTK